MEDGFRSGTGIIWVILFILVLLSAFFSGTEAAYLGVNKIRLKNRIEKMKKSKRYVGDLTLSLVDNFEKVLTTILICNNIVNIVFSTLSAALFAELFGPIGVGYAVFFTTVIVLIFGEITPKAIAKKYAVFVCLASARILNFVTYILTPLSFLFNSVQRLALRLVGASGEDGLTATEEELRTLVETMTEEDVLDDEQKELIHSAITFNDQTLQDIYIPRVDVFAIDIQTPPEEFMQEVLASGYSRIPVYEKNIDNVIGILNVRDLLVTYFKNQVFDIQNVLRPALFLSEIMPIDNALQTMKKSKSHIAIIVDEYGGMVGVLTLEDILEELVGEIYDEYDKEEIPLFIEVGEGHYRASGEIDLEDLFETELGQEKAPEGKYDTLGGFAYEMLESIPKEGQTFHYKQFLFKIEKMQSRRVMLVDIRIQSDYQEED